jgi:hypothetical protein
MGVESRFTWFTGKPKVNQQGNDMTDNLITKAEFARICQVSKPAVAKWVAQGCAIETNSRIDVKATADAMTRLRRDGVPAAFSAWLAGGACAPRAGKPARSGSGTTELRREHIVARLKEKDWTTPFDPDPATFHARAVAAAKAIGLELIQSDLRDDGHWGGYQLRYAGASKSGAAINRSAIVAGFGFELEDFDVLSECREAIDHPDAGPDDLFIVNLDLLSALAFPFGPHHTPTDD